MKKKSKVATKKNAGTKKVPKNSAVGGTAKKKPERATKKAKKVATKKNAGTTAKASKRDEFPSKVRAAVAHRSGYQCSFRGCSRLTAGPSDVLEMATVNVGIAAHIHAASPEGPRYLESMTSEERKSIQNAMWTCAFHGNLVDKDHVRYPAEDLRKMKSAHEERIAQILATSDGASIHYLDLIGIGPDVFVTGEVASVDGNNWSIRVEHFVSGELIDLQNFVDGFENLGESKKYLLVDSFGEGRSLVNVPKWRKSDRKLFVDFVVAPKCERIDAQSIKTDFKLDLDLMKIDLNAVVSGIDALPQKVTINLGMKQGERLMTPGYGSRIGEFFTLYGASPFFAQMVKLECIRLSSIPHNGLTPFQAVQRVKSIELIDDTPHDRKLRIRVEFEVAGVGKWSHDIKLFITDQD